MIVQPKKTTIAYRCPRCGSGVMTAVGIFSFSADRVVLKCTNPDCPAKTDAGGPNDRLDIVYPRNGDTDIRLTVPCIFCGKPHYFNVNPSIFFNRDIFSLPCPYSGIEICFMGETNHVKAELARSELELLDMLEENGIESFGDLTGEEDSLPDPQVLEVVMFVIRDLEAEGKIFCRCNPDGTPAPEEEDGDSFPESRYDAEVTDSGVLVTCKQCGAKKLIPTDSLIRAHDFLNCDSLSLE